MPAARHVLVLTLSLLGLFAHPPAASAHALDDRALARLGRTLQRAQAVRIVTRRDHLLVHDASVDRAGVHWSGVVDGAGRDSLGGPGSVAWANVVEIDTRVPGTLRGAGYGALLLGGGAVLAGVIVGAAQGADINSVGMGLIAGMFGAPAGAAVGAGYGATTHHWKAVFPRQPGPWRRLLWEGLRGT